MSTFSRSFHVFKSVFELLEALVKLKLVRITTGVEADHRVMDSGTRLLKLAKCEETAT